MVIGNLWFLSSFLKINVTKRDTTARLLEWPKSRTLSTECRRGRGVTRSSYSRLPGMQNTAATLQDSLAVSYTTAHALTVRSGSRALWPLSREDENLRSHRNLHTNVYSSFIRNCWNLKATEMLFTRWVDEHWSIQTVGHYSALKRNERTRRNLKGMLLSEKANPKRLHIVWF